MNMSQFINTNTKENLKATSKASWHANSSVSLKNRFNYYAKKYYGTDDISKLEPYQIDKISGWVLKHSPNKGKSQSRKAEAALRQNKKFTKSAHKIKNKNIGK